MEFTWGQFHRKSSKSLWWLREICTQRCSTFIWFGYIVIVILVNSSHWFTYNLCSFIGLGQSLSQVRVTMIWQNVKICHVYCLLVSITCVCLFFMTICQFVTRLVTDEADNCHLNEWCHLNGKYIIKWAKLNQNHRHSQAPTHVCQLKVNKITDMDFMINKMCLREPEPNFWLTLIN